MQNQATQLADLKNQVEVLKQKEQKETQQKKETENQMQQAL